MCPKSPSGSPHGSGQFTLQGYYIRRSTSASYEYFKHCAAAQRPEAFERRFESRGGLKMKHFMILMFCPPRVGAIWELSRRGSSEHIEDPKLGLSKNDTLIYSPAANGSHIENDLKDFEKIIIIHPNSPSGSRWWFLATYPAGVLLTEGHLCKLLTEGEILSSAS